MLIAIACCSYRILALPRYASHVFLCFENFLRLTGKMLGNYATPALYQTQSASCFPNDSYLCSFWQLSLFITLSCAAQFVYLLLSKVFPALAARNILTERILILIIKWLWDLMDSIHCLTDIIFLYYHCQRILFAFA